MLWRGQGDEKAAEVAAGNGGGAPSEQVRGEVEEDAGGGARRALGVRV